MYKFTNGIVVFDEKTRDDFIKAGYKLVEEDCYWMNRTFIGYFKTKSEAKKYLSDCVKK